MAEAFLKKLQGQGQAGNNASSLFRLDSQLQTVPIDSSSQGVLPGVDDVLEAPLLYQCRGKPPGVGYRQDPAWAGQKVLHHTAQTLS